MIEFTRRHLNSLLVGAAATVVARPTLAEVGPVHVIEMFTSQGCSSCPPADRLLTQLKERPDVLALSFHVDYWDRLGWKDTFGSQLATQRQRNYALARGDGQVYTPQAVINGRLHAVGHDRGGIETAMAATVRERIALSMRKVGNRIQIDADDASRRGVSGELTIIGVRDRGAVTATRGENSGRTLSYSNIVLGVGSAGRLQSAALQATVGLDDPALAEADVAVALLQSQPHGPVIGIGRLRLRLR